MHFFILLNFLLLTHSLKGIAPIIHLLIELYNSFKICYSRLLFLEIREYEFMFKFIFLEKNSLEIVTSSPLL